MFKFDCYLNSLEIKEALNIIQDYIKRDGYISKKNYLKIMAPQLKTGPEDDLIGWGLEQACREFRQDYNPMDSFITFVLEDPVEIIRPNQMTTLEDISGNEFDTVSHPAHYTEGRNYEPRKVIADWGLNFNLGNAVKYLARAGRKGDKIEDLRKAIQYIEFEIDECSKHSEYEELLNSLKNKPVEDQIKIVEELKLSLNKKYGVGGKKDE